MIYFTFQHFPILDSTNEEALSQLAQGAPSGTIIVADEQTKGRGQQGRSWHSAVGNLFVSLILRPSVPLNAIGQLSFVAALALQKALNIYLKDPNFLSFKWPNDILVQKAKVAGILTETSILGEELQGCVVGIGVNINSMPELKDRLFAPTFLAKHSIKKVDKDQLLQTIIVYFKEVYEQWLTDGFSSIRQQWLASAYHYGEFICFQNELQQGVGKFVDVDTDGAMILQEKDKKYRILSNYHLKYLNNL